MDTDALKALQVFADVGCNLTRAGEALGLSQPAVHARLVALGRALEVTLYERRGRRLALTASGEAVVARAREMLHSEAALRAELRGDVDGAIVIACGEGALVHVVAERVAALCRRPGALRFLVADGPGALAALRSAHAHLAVVAGPTAFQASDLVGVTIAQSRLVAVGAADALPPARRLGVKALCALPLIAPPPGRPLRAALEEAAANAGARLNVTVEVSSWHAALRLAALGVGVGVVNDVVAGEDQLRRVPIEGLPSVTYRLLRRRGRAGPLTARIDEVADAIVGLPGTPAPPAA